MRRIRRFSVTPDLLMLMGSGKFEVVANPLPEDAALVGAFYDEASHLFTVIVQSKTFRPVKEGKVIPSLYAPTIRRIE